VCVSVGVAVVGETSERRLLLEETHTTVVNAHGGAILLHSKVKMGQLLRLKNPQTQAELFCRVAYLGPIQSGLAEVGIEFMQPTPQFWHIAFPPLDWTPRNSDTKHYAPKTTQKT
jgi:hypothetical protein